MDFINYGVDQCYRAHFNFEATKDEKEHILKITPHTNTDTCLQFLPKRTESEKLFTVSSQLNIGPNAIIRRNVKIMGLFRPDVCPFCSFKLKFQNHKHFSLMNCFLSMATIGTSRCHVSYFWHLIQSPICTQCKATDEYFITTEFTWRAFITVFVKVWQDAHEVRSSGLFLFRMDFALLFFSIFSFLLANIFKI